MKTVKITRDGREVASFTPAEFSQFVRDGGGIDSGLSQGLEAYVDQYNSRNERTGYSDRAIIQE